MKKFLFGVLTAVMMFGFGSFTQASDVDTVNLSCRGNIYCDGDNYNGGYCNRQGNYYCDADSDDNYRGKYCGRHGCNG